MTEQQLHDMRRSFAIRGKNGVGFLMAAVVIWLAITVIFTSPLGIEMKNILLLFTTGFMFPLSILFTTIIKAEWRFKGEPLAGLGGVLNVAQIIYFPLVFWAFVESPEHLVIFFAIIIGAHFLPYGWFYHTKIYYVMSIIISVGILIIGWTISSQLIWLIPFTMTILLVVLIGLLYMNYKKRQKA